jgi:DNA-binding NtrC family response regulator
MSNIRPVAADALSVLIVDDEQRLRDMLTRAVGEMGYQVQSARSSEQAMRLLEKAPADILILDLNLPGMSGLDLFDQIHMRWPNTQVIILTGFGDLEAAKKAIRLDVVDFLTKPCALGNLEIALSRARMRRTTGELTPNPSLEPEVLPVPTVPGGEATLNQLEQSHILAVLDRHHGNRAATAAELGISVRTLYYRLSEYQRQGLIV